MAKTERIVFDFQRARSESSRNIWERRWEQAYERGEKLGPKGEQYIEEKYGPEYDEPDYDDPYDFEDEYP